MHSLPNMPEPTPGQERARFVVTVVGHNRSGVLAEITRALAEMNANVHDISQRIIEGYFHLILTAELPQGTPFEATKQTLECMGGESDYAVRVMHERAFHFMHRI